MSTLLTKLHALRQELNQILLERETAIEAALLALLTGEHLLLLGPPGTAKSLMVRSICERIDGATYFERLLTRFSTICAAAHIALYAQRGYVQRPLAAAVSGLIFSGLSPPARP